MGIKEFANIWENFPNFAPPKGTIQNINSLYLQTPKSRYCVDEIAKIGKIHFGATIF